MLKYQLDSLDGLTDDEKKMYKEKDGKFVLVIEGLPQQEDVSGLKAKIDELMDEKKDAARKAKEEQQAREEAERKAKEEAAKKSGDVEALEKSWKEKFDSRERELTDEIEGLKSSVNTMMVDNVAVKLANEIAISGSAAVLIPHITSRLAAEQRDGEFVTVVKDGAGRPSASTLDELKKEFIDNPVFAPVIVGSRASGGGANGSGGKGGALDKKPSEYTEAERVKLYRENPEKFKELFGKK